MDTNVGQTDRSIRIALGALAGIVSLAILADIVSLPMLAAPILGIVAIVLLATAAIQYCGAYTLLGIDTCPVTRDE
ncbi:DUF2892 domain-containing protein [Halobacteria archaeon AArc-dxtr1]|nr:DUF2892 domain-containing protein [Halobacteria archaeon AArc-dxtr1]